MEARVIIILSPTIIKIMNSGLENNNRALANNMVLDTYSDKDNGDQEFVIVVKAKVKVRITVVVVFFVIDLYLFPFILIFF